MRHLDDLAALGVTVVQIDAGGRVPGRLRLGLRRRRSVRPVATLSADPTTCAASSIGPTRSASAVILDVVYNHVGPDGNYLRAFARDYFSDRYENEWGEALNFDGPQSRRCASGC